MSVYWSRINRTGHGEPDLALYFATADLLADRDAGDITISGSGLTWTIDTGAVTLAKMADVATGTVFYRKTAGTGVPEVQTLATLKTDLDLTGTNSGDQTITLTGDVTGSGTGSFAATLATAQPSAHTWAATQTFTLAPVFTDQSGSRTALGLGTLATQSGTFSGGGTLVTGGFTLTVGATASISGNSSGTNTGDQTITLTGAVTGSGTGSFATTLAAHGLLTVNTTASTVSNTVAETNFTPNHVITGNTVAVGQVYRLRAWGVYGTDAATSSTQRFRVKAGTTVLGDSTAKNNGLGLTNRGWQIDCYIVVTATGAGGNAECQGTCGMSTTATATGFCDMENTAVVSIDWTSNQTFQVSVEHSAADTDITATMRLFLFERVV